MIRHFYLDYCLCLESLQSIVQVFIFITYSFQYQAIVSHRDLDFLSLSLAVCEMKNERRKEKGPG